MSDSPCAKPAAERMHPFEWPPYVIERVIAKRGKLHVFDQFDPAETALLVVDMQNFFVAEIETARAIVPNINRLASALRQSGGLVVWISHTAGEAGKSLWPTYHDNFFSEAKRRNHRDALSHGSESHKLYAALDTQPGDLRVEKTRFSAFIQGASDLHARLRERNISNLIITGTATNFCCETTGRDASMLDYRVVIVADGTAARYDEDHIAGLTTFFQNFGDVRLTDEVINRMLAPATSAASERATTR